MSIETAEKEQLDKLMLIIQETLARDEKLRKEYDIGDKFRFIRERLVKLLNEIEHISYQETPATKSTDLHLEDDETLVYVYLYNANGAVFASWQNMLTPKVFYEYSVNRPIYAEKNHIEEWLKTKKNRAQQAYLTIAIKKKNILKTLSEQNQDTLGNPLIKVREGSLHYEKLVRFTHENKDYVVTPAGEFVRI